MKTHILKNGIKLLQSLLVIMHMHMHIILRSQLLSVPAVPVPATAPAVST